MKYKVGDKVRIKSGEYGHEFDIGAVVTIEDVGSFDYLATDGSGKWWVSDEEVEHAYTITVGNTYTDRKGDVWECIFVRDGIAWIEKYNRTAYMLDANTGKSVCLNDEYDIVFTDRRNGSVEYVNGVPQFDTWMEEE